MCNSKYIGSPVYSQVHASPIFTYKGASDPLSSPHYFLEKSVALKINLKPHNNPPNPLPNVPADPDSDPSFSDSSLSKSSDSLDKNYYKQRQRAKKYKNKLWSKILFVDSIKKCAKLKSKLIAAAYKSKVIKLKLDEDTLQRLFYPS